LATGGGKADGCIKIWNVYNENNQIKNVDTQSQISGLLWSDKNRELLSSHGYNQNNLVVWKYPQMERLVELNGHANRVLSVAVSANGEMVASLGADQTIRFWECFKVPQTRPVYSTPVSLSSLKHSQNIR
jgi:cell division cycle protein 20 (cofactor of APC complex)